jgi:hypothetical protein
MMVRTTGWGRGISLNYRNARPPEQVNAAALAE